MMTFPYQKSWDFSQITLVPISPISSLKLSHTKKRTKTKKMTPLDPNNKNFTENHKVKPKQSNTFKTKQLTHESEKKLARTMKTTAPTQHESLSLGHVP